MASNFFNRLAPASKGQRSFYQQLRSRDRNGDDSDDGDLYANHDVEAGLDVDEDNFRHGINEFDSEDIIGDSRITSSSPAFAAPDQLAGGGPMSWKRHDDDVDNDVPASLLVEHNDNPTSTPSSARKTNRAYQARHSPCVDISMQRPRLQWDAAGPDGPTDCKPHDVPHPRPHARSVTARKCHNGPKEQALWRWVNISNLDGFMKDAYDYFEGGGFWCILLANALRLFETLFVAVFLTFLTQCVDYNKLPQSKSLDQVVIQRCTSNMSGPWSVAIWLYSFFFIWKIGQYFLEIRRLSRVRQFYIHLLEIPEQDMQTVSWQDIVARVMTLRDQNPKTATNMPRNLRKYIGSQSKERLDAHDIANRLMRKENYLIAMINKDLLDLSLPFPFLRGRQLLSKTMEWNLKFCILDFAFNDLGQVQQDFLRADRRGLLSEKLKQRFFFAGCLNLLLAPVVLAYVVIVYFFTYYNEYQKDPKLAAARKYTTLAEWKFREFNELPHIFYERLHMSVPFATRYVDQFPKRMTEHVARSIAFISGAVTTVLALLTVLDSELFLGFEITRDRTVLFYLGVFGAVWAITRGMVSEDTAVFNPEYAIRSVTEYTHYMPDHWQGRLHSFEIKQEFDDLFKMKVVTFLEEVMGIITTSLLLLLSLPKCSDQIVDFFREFTVHVDGLGYVCSFAVFDFKKGVDGGQAGQRRDVREDYYSTKHGKMAASYYGFIDNYVTNPKSGIPGHIPQGSRHHFHTAPGFPGPQSPTLTAYNQGSHVARHETGRIRSREGGPGPSMAVIPAPSPMASMLLDPRHQPTALSTGKSLHRSRYPYGKFQGDSRIIEEMCDDVAQDDGRARGRMAGMEEESFEEGGILGESAWQTSPGKGLSRDNSATNTEEPQTGVLGLISQFTQHQHNLQGF